MTPLPNAAVARGVDLVEVYGEGDAAVRALDGVSVTFAGVVAAVFPARRAARLDVLAAIAYE